MTDRMDGDATPIPNGLGTEPLLRYPQRMTIKLISGWAAMVVFWVLFILLSLDGHLWQLR